MINEIESLNPVFIEALARVRYWEDADVNGQEDSEGDLIPLRNGDCWNPIINLKTGLILNWPKGVCATVHYKVCDEGEYWLLDENQNRIARWNGYYVPNDFYCPGTNGFGDYIIMNINSEGEIKNWHQPEIDVDYWDVL